MPAFKVTALGPDNCILQVWCGEEQWLRSSLTGAPNAGMTDLDTDGLHPHDYDFIMPKDVQALHDRLGALARIPLLRQMVRGADYMHGTQRVTFVASDPKDGAYLICQYWDDETDDQAYLGCEASDLRFLPLGENQQP